jgi:phosphoheptose isomerase
MNPLHHNLDALKQTLDGCRSLDATIQKAADLISTALKSGNKLLTCGNGGSAADAMHLATEFVCRYDKDRRAYPAICLNANGGDLTAISNDYQYEKSFERQVNAFAKPGDVLVVFTTSGKSRNVLLAIQAAEKIGAKSIAFLGKGGGQTLGKATVDILVPGDVTARIQEAQKFLLHTMCEIVETQIPNS